MREQRRRVFELIECGDECEAVLGLGGGLGLEVCLFSRQCVDLGIQLGDLALGCVARWQRIDDVRERLVLFLVPTHDPLVGQHGFEGGDLGAMRVDKFGCACDKRLIMNVCQGWY